MPLPIAFVLIATAFALAWILRGHEQDVRAYRVGYDDAMEDMHGAADEAYDSLPIHDEDKGPVGFAEFLTDEERGL
jgi:hypothetical protein